MSGLGMSGLGISGLGARGMRGRWSIRTTYQAAFVVLALAAVGVTGWVASVDAGRALQEATYDRLTAIRETRRHALERYFEELGKHVVALSTSEATARALAEFGTGWERLEPGDGPPHQNEALARFYATVLAPRVARGLPHDQVVDAWLPRDGRARRLQFHAIAANPHPPESKDLLLDLPETGDYGRAHARHHPTFHRYQTAFGFYDIFLISAPAGRVLYTVMKEVDLGADLTAAPYRSTRLGRLFARALAAGTSTTAATPGVVIEDYAPYIASAFAPAAFIGAPIRVAGATVGVLAMQISIREVDRVMTGEQRWSDEGLGATGQVYAVGADATLRSDLRRQIEEPERFYADLARTRVPAAVVQAMRDNQTAVLTLPMDVPGATREGRRGSEAGVNLFGTPVLRSYAPLDVAELGWTVVAEIDAAEALAPVRAVRLRLFTVGLGIGSLFLVVATWLGASVTRPVLELARSVAEIGSGARNTTVAVRSADEIGQLAEAFNRMSRDLARTTVSKTELEVLAGRLISAQEDERRRVARELHDDLVQRLAAAAIALGQLERLPPASADLPAGLTRLKRMMAVLSEDVHRLSRRIHPAMLDELGLIASLEAECRAFMERGGPPVDVTVDGAFGDLPDAYALAIFRIAQEALRNALAHAHAAEVTLILRRQPEAVELIVQDDGKGFSRESDTWHAGLGLASMEERARLIGGSLVVTSAAGAGTRVHVRLPLPAHHEEASRSPR
jgi:signal transduction histidine kinase